MRVLIRPCCAVYSVYTFVCTKRNKLFRGIKYAYAHTRIAHHTTPHTYTCCTQRYLGGTGPPLPSKFARTQIHIQQAYYTRLHAASACAARIFASTFISLLAARLRRTHTHTHGPASFTYGAERAARCARDATAPASARRCILYVRACACERVCVRVCGTAANDGALQRTLRAARKLP